MKNLNSTIVFLILILAGISGYSQITSSQELINDTQSVSSFDYRNKDLVGSNYIDENFLSAKLNIDEIIYSMRYDAYQDEMEIGTLGTFKCASSKYFDVEIGLLKKGFYLNQDYNGDIEINKVASTFEGAEISGKNCDVELPLGNLKYQLEVDAKNADISLEEEDLEAGLISEKNNQLQIKGKMNNANDRSPKVIIKGYNIDIDLD